MSFWLLLFLFSETPQKITLEPAGIYQPFQLRIYKVGNRFIFCGLSERSLALVGNGKVEAFYNKTGKGPQEFDGIFPLGVRDKKLFICSGRKNILVFDEKLQILSEPMPNFPVPDLRVGFGYGNSLGNGEWLVSFQRQSHLLYWVKLDSSQATLLDKKGKQKNMIESSFAALSNQMVFLSKAEILYKDYQILVLPAALSMNNPLELQAITELQGNLSEFPTLTIPGTNIDYNVLLWNVMKHAKGYIVEFGSSKSVKDVQMGKPATTWLDFFDLKGKWLKRRNIGQDQLIPVVNGEEIFRWSEETETLQLATEQELQGSN